jgi:carotenoid cleavage dioxygenase-like enzyme
VLHWCLFGIVAQSDHKGKVDWRTAWISLTMRAATRSAAQLIVSAEEAGKAGDTMTRTDVVPFHLTGNFRPVSDERTVLDLPVTGQLPGELRGSFLRNGPNPDGASAHWFVGDGMVHGVRLEAGQALWYRNRWVQTDSFTQGLPFRDAQYRRDHRASKANTHVICHAGRILALVETSFPYQLTDELETVGWWDFDGRLTTAMTAHPKVCAATGEMHFFGYDQRPPLVTCHVVDPAGRLVTTRPVEVPRATMMHDFNLTERFVVFMDLPIVFDRQLAMAGGVLPFRYDPSCGARLGVLRRDDPHGAMRWFDVEPCYVFHALNAHDDGNVVTIDVSRLAAPTREGGGITDAVLWRWTIDLAAGTVTECQLDDRPGDFPRVDDRLTGRPARRGWITSMPDPRDGATSGSITVYDLPARTSTTHQFRDGRVPSEAVFAPGDDTPGGPGWLLSYVYDPVRDASDLVVLDHERPQEDPVATIELPARAPYGFHGSWIPAD